LTNMVGLVGNPSSRQRSKVQSSLHARIGPLKADSLPSGMGKTVYISPPRYLVEDGIG
nr:hypothetical protein [Tanacetum cinerariifolium]